MSDDGMLEDFCANAPMGLQSLAPDGEVLWANSAQAAMLGYDLDEYVGQHISRLYADPELARSFLNRLASGETLHDFAVPMRQRDGAIRHVLIHANAYREDGRFVHTRCFVRDVTDLRRVEKALEDKAVALARADRQKDQFLATLSHELRSPLNAVLGWARLLRRGQLDGLKRDEAIVTIERNATAQVKLIDELLDMSRIASGKIVLDTRPLDLAELVTEVAETFRPAAAARSVALEARVEGNVAPFAGDGERLVQVIGNLVSNALKFTPAGGRVTVELTRENGSAVVTVRDTGRGISRDFLPHVFDRFRQADESSGSSGLGLGLAIARHLVALHRGTIVAASDGEDRGAVFRVTLPLLSARANTSLPSVPVRPAAPARLEGVTVLVIDDEPDTLELFRAVLEHGGATVQIARTALEGLQILRRDRPHVLVSDIGLPGIDGYGLIAAVRRLSFEEGGATPACALTAYARAEDREKVLAAGFQMHLAKPVDPADLGHAIGALARAT